MPIKYNLFLKWHASYSLNGYKILLLVLYTQNSLYVTLYMEIYHLNVLLKLFPSYFGLFRIKLALNRRWRISTFTVVMQVLHSVLNFFSTKHTCNLTYRKIQMFHMGLMLSEIHSTINQCIFNIRSHWRRGKMKYIWYDVNYVVETYPGGYK